MQHLRVIKSRGTGQEKQPFCLGVVDPAPYGLPEPFDQLVLVNEPRRRAVEHQGRIGAGRRQGGAVLIEPNFRRGELSGQGRFAGGLCADDQNAAVCRESRRHAILGDSGNKPFHLRDCTLDAKGIALSLIAVLHGLYHRPSRPRLRPCTTVLPLVSSVPVGGAAARSCVRYCRVGWARPWSQRPK